VRTQISINTSLLLLVSLVLTSVHRSRMTLIFFTKGSGLLYLLGNVPGAGDQVELRIGMRASELPPRVFNSETCDLSHPQYHAGPVVRFCAPTGASRIVL